MKMMLTDTDSTKSAINSKARATRNPAARASDIQSTALILEIVGEMVFCSVEQETDAL